MQRLKHVAAMLILAIGLVTGCTNPKGATTAAGSASDTTTGNTAVRDSVQTVLRQFADRMNSGDLKGAGELYSNSNAFFWIEQGTLSYRSAREVRDALLTLKSSAGIDFKYYETRIDVLAPGVASVRTEFSQTFMTGVGKGTTYGGYLSITMVRDPEGWRMRNGHTSSRRPRE